MSSIVHLETQNGCTSSMQPKLQSSCFATANTQEERKHTRGCVSDLCVCLQSCLGENPYMSYRFDLWPLVSTNKSQTAGCKGQTHSLWDFQGEFSLQGVTSCMYTCGGWRLWAPDTRRRQQRELRDYTSRQTLGSLGLRSSSSGVTWQPTKRQNISRSLCK